jgi:hypothetical protein
MITNNGKEVLSKYLLGQAPAYATHIAIGCGSAPLSTSASLTYSDYSDKETLDFEMLRIPISSRGFVEDGGITKIALTAELPTENRYEITEVGLWSSANNTLARGFDSKIIFDFQEGWQAHDVTISSIPLRTGADFGSGGNISDGGNIVFRGNCGDPVLETSSRKSRDEGPRFLNTSIFMRGDSSNILSSDYEITSASASGTAFRYVSASHGFSLGDKVTITGTSNSLFDIVNATISGASANSFEIARETSSYAAATGGTAWKTGTWQPEEVDGDFVSTHIHLNAINFNIGENSPTDELSFTFSLVDKDSIGNGNPEYVKILLEFFRNEIEEQTGFAKAEIYIDGAEFSNRYKTIKFPISQLITSPDFTSSQIRVARIFAYVAVDDGSGGVEGSTDHYVALDGFRLDNVSTENPLYKLVGYSPTQTSDGYPIVKFQNTNNYVEFRFGIGVS